MKTQLLCFIIVIICSLQINSKKSVKQDKQEKVKHVSEVVGNIPDGKDNHPLWNDLNNKNFEKVNYNGVHGSTWTPPVGNTDSNNGEFTHIASPNKNVNQAKGVRVIANDLPAKTESASSFDLPPRKNVLQVDLPNSTMKTTNFSYNANAATANNGAPNLRPILHGIEAVSPRVLHGRFKQIDKKDKNNLSNGRKRLQEAAKKAYDLAQSADTNAAKVMSLIEGNPGGYALEIKTLNKKAKH